MSNLTETGTAAFDFFVSLVKDPAARCKIETMLLDVERESFELGLDNESPGEDPWADDEGINDAYQEGYEDGREGING